MILRRAIEKVKKENTFLEPVLEKRNNNFLLLRLLAAFGVIFRHSFDLVKNEHFVSIRQLVCFRAVGTLSLDFLFFLSGLLITASFFNSESIKGFIIRRVLRLWPGLIVCILITTFIVGPIVSTLNFEAYFSSPVTHCYLTANLLQYEFSYLLPGVFEHNLYPNVVNGSLWTLSTEIRCYIFIVIVGVATLLTKRILFLLLVIAISFSFLFKPQYLVFVLVNLERVHLFLLFLAGAVVYVFRDKIILNNYAAVLFILLWMLFGTYHTRFTSLPFYCTFLYTMLCLAKSKLVHKIKLKEDYSYGIYIYGFLIQQCLVFYFPNITSWISLAVTLLIVIPIAMLSWHTIEKPSIQFAKRL